MKYNLYRPTRINQGLCFNANSKAIKFSTVILFPMLCKFDHPLTQVLFTRVLLQKSHLPRSISLWNLFSLFLLSSLTLLLNRLVLQCLLCAEWSETKAKRGKYDFQDTLWFNCNIMQLLTFYLCSKATFIKRVLPSSSNNFSNTYTF